MLKNERYPKAVYRNLCEVVNALHERQVLISLEEYIKKNGKIFYYGGSFLHIARDALFNDMIAHIIKVLDRNRDSTGFWYIFKTDKGMIKNCESYSESKIKFLDELAPKLKIVRDKSHFHIDKNGVLDPKAVWSEAGITGDELGKGVDYLLDILLEVNNKVRGCTLSRNNYIYTGEDFFQLLELARTNGIIEVFESDEAKARV